MADLLPLAFAAGLLVFAAASDVATMKIPNWISIALAAVFPIAALLSGAPWQTIALHMGFGAAILGVGFLLFQAGVFGGGDAKLIAGAAVWTGLGAFGVFALWTAIAGGVLALVLLVARKIVAPSEAQPAFVSRLLRPKGGVPYGVAIAIGALMALDVASLAQRAAALTAP